MNPVNTKDFIDLLRSTHKAEWEASPSAQDAIPGKPSKGKAFIMQLF
jgi:hypothetical protein